VTASISTRFYYARGDTAMPGGLHATFCHTFLVNKVLIKMATRQIFVDFFDPHEGNVGLMRVKFVVHESS